ncbi:MAG TPA: OmpA family protein [Candidatus Cybelea sp.]|nr:OmpA family protein [Candidatus Cybelea sp.]
MTRLKTRLLLATAISVMPALAFADDVPGARQGWYASLGGGLNILRNSDVKGGGFETTAKFSNGYVVPAAIGYSWGHLRAEIEGGYRRNSLDTLNPGGSASGHASSLDGMVNGYYDILPDNRIDPYIGAGIGVARVKASDVAGANGRTILSDSDTKFAYQGIAGARYLVAPQWDLGAEYRYFATTTPHMTTTAATAPANVGVETPYRNHSILLNLTYHFARPAPAPMAAPAPAATTAPPPPPPPPPAQAMPNVYLVFFAFDKSDISPVAAQVLDRAVADFKRSGQVKFLVQGYTDLSGSVAYNEGLSERRADAVQAYLLAHGVTKAQITTEWFGKKNPRVPTADGVRNQENRRAEIYLKK